MPDINLHEKIETISVRPGSKVTIRSEDAFIVHGLIEGKFADVLGPKTQMDRVFTFNSQNFEEIKVITKGKWTSTVFYLDRMEKPDPVPHEIPDQRPLTIREEMMLYVRDMFSEQAVSQGNESFEEADDFEVDQDGDDEFGLSKYEFTEMQAEEPIDNDYFLPAEPQQPPEQPEEPVEAPQEESTPTPA